MNIPATEIHVNGIVQGVGFRPFVYRQATRNNLKGWISNSADGVVIRVSGTPNGIDALIKALEQEPPPLARISSLELLDSTLPVSTAGFSIIESDTGHQSNTHVSPDIATCPECVSDIHDPDNRRLGYPFTNCTNCGPRYSIIRTLPYDRDRTTMAAFTMCEQCLTEYTDPTNRRFHAQPNACPQCGPQLSWRQHGDSTGRTDDPLALTARALRDGLIVAVKGLGGFHLAANAYSEPAVGLLRSRKKRPAKPLAIMARDIETIQKLCFCSPAEEQQLCSITSPVVLLRNRSNNDLAGNLAPGINELGVMLPYTPLHHLLFNHQDTPDCLVMTSGNLAGDPLCKDNDESIARLGPFCDAFLMHDRGIRTRVDDSVIRLMHDQPRFLRRSRGYAPAPIRLAVDIPPILAVGAELKNCFCLARNHDAFMSQHIGDLNNLSTLDFFGETLDRLQELLEIEPQAVIADLHPDYLSTGFARELDLPLVQVQHHWAHAASVMAEHRLTESLAIILDGTGLGPDNTVWGGEILHCSLTKFKRLGHLSLLSLPGGDKAARQPWRMALAAIAAAEVSSPEAEIHLGSIPEENRFFIRDMITKGINCPATSSCGRLFDAVGSLLGLCQENTFEGQAAMEVEACAAKALGSRSLLDTSWFAEINKQCCRREENGLLELLSPLLIRQLVAKMKRNAFAAPDLALFFHAFLVSGFGNMIRYLHDRTGIDTVVISGGSMQNRLLAEGFTDFFAATRLKLYTNVQVPANDGGLALGQALIGGTHVSGNSHAG